MGAGERRINLCWEDPVLLKVKSEEGERLLEESLHGYHFPNPDPGQKDISLYLSDPPHPVSSSSLGY